MQSKRGRPAEADPHAVSLAALRLFEQKGFDRVTMDQVAKAAGISRRTLFRLFPAKADLVWDGLSEVLDAVEGHVARATSLSVLVEELFLPTLHMLDDPTAAKMARRRLRIIAANTSLFTHKKIAALEAIVAAAVPKDGPPPSLVARSLVSVAFGAILWWAEHQPKMTALEVTRAAFSALRT